MDLIEISCPSKTFVLGEYGVLDQGPAIIFNTVPRFKCLISKSHNNFSEEIFLDSPEHQWIQKNPVEFGGISLKWFNPFDVQKGFGFSSAKFNILYAYSCFARGDSIETIKPQQLWRTYRSMKFEGVVPSGADVISQWVGGVCIFEQNPLSVESLTAPFPNLGFFVLKTGESLDTYQYLKSLKLPDVSDLKKIAQKGVDSMKFKQADKFIESIQEYREALQVKGLITKKTQKILQDLLKIKEIKACKGCGAMGAETLIVIFNIQDKELVRSKVSHLEIKMDEQQLTYGVEFHKIITHKETYNG